MNFILSLKRIRLLRPGRSRNPRTTSWISADAAGEVSVSHFVFKDPGVQNSVRWHGADSRTETRHTDPTQVEIDTLDRGVKRQLVRRKPLEGAHSRAGANNRNEIARQHFIVDPLLQRIAHVHDAVERKAEVINDHRHRAMDLVRPQNGRRRGRRNGAVPWLCRNDHGRCRSRACQVDEFDIGDLLELPVLKEFEVVRRKVRNMFALVVGHNRVYLDQVYVNPDDSGGTGVCWAPKSIVSTPRIAVIPSILVERQMVMQRVTSSQSLSGICSSTFKKLRTVG